MSTSQVVSTDATGQDDGGPRRQTGIVNRLGINRFGGIYFWILLVVLFWIWVPDTFPTSTTFRTVTGNVAVTTLVALALIIPLACGLFDLSVAANLGVASVLVLELQSKGVNPVLAVLITLLVGTAIGVVNAAFVVLVGVDSFIITLGMSSILAAFAFYITSGNQLIAKLPSTFVSLGQENTFGVPRPFWYMLIVAAILVYVTEFTTVGRYLYAIGGNPEAARLVGIRVGRVRFGAMVASGLLASFAGVVLAAQLGSSSADVGPAYLLPAFSAVLLGATQIKTNGRANVPGTLVAVILLATGIYGLQLAGSPSYIANLFNGAALVIAVSLAVRANRRG